MAMQGQRAKIAAQNAVVKKHGFCRQVNSMDNFYHNTQTAVDGKTLEDVHITVREAVDHSNLHLSRDGKNQWLINDGPKAQRLKQRKRHLQGK